MATDPLAQIAARVPDKPALIEDRPGQPVARWSFAELNASVNVLANALREDGVRSA